MYKIKKKIIYIFEGLLLFLVFILLKLLPVNFSSKLMGFISMLIGPNLGVSKKAYNNIKSVFMENFGIVKFEPLWDRFHSHRVGAALVPRWVVERRFSIFGLREYLRAVECTHTV